jgi:hypothetical protein
MFTMNVKAVPYWSKVPTTTVSEGDVLEIYRHCDAFTIGRLKDKRWFVKRNAPNNPIDVAWSLDELIAHSLSGNERRMLEL